MTERLPASLEPAPDAVDLLARCEREERLAGGLHIRGVELSGTRYEGLRLHGVLFEGCRLTGCRWERADLCDVVFRRCDLSNSYWRGGFFERAEIGRASCRERV